MKIYLVGFMGCGKSSTGKRLASLCRLSFVDTDVLFEQKHQCSIFDFYTTHTEEEFRKEEQDILFKTQSLNNSIIATGGGMPCFEKNMEWMLANGVVVYIEMSPAALYARIINSKKKRPLLPSKETLMEYIKTQLAQREDTYKQAHITLRVGKPDMNILIKAINDFIGAV